MDETKEQFVYGMTNQTFQPDMVKIGWTREHPSIRAINLQTSGVPTPFNVVFVIKTPEGSKLEKIIHEHLKKYRVNSNREFFKISIDELTEILTKELTLELTLLTEIITTINKKSHHGKPYNEIKKLYEILEKEAHDFFGKLKKEKTELVIKEINNKKYVSVRTIETVSNRTCLDCHGFENKDERRIKDAYYFINQDIKIYKEWLDKIINHYDEIKEEIGIKQIRTDNKSFKEMLLYTQDRYLYKLQNDYVWEL
jgi:hypothetical protein